MNLTNLPGAPIVWQLLSWQDGGAFTITKGPPMPRTVRALTAVLLALALPACGDDKLSSPPSRKPDPATAQPPRAKVAVPVTVDRRHLARNEDVVAIAGKPTLIIKRPDESRMIPLSDQVARDLAAPPVSKILTKEEGLRYMKNRFEGRDPNQPLIPPPNPVGTSATTVTE